MATKTTATSSEMIIDGEKTYILADIKQHEKTDVAVNTYPIRTVMRMIDKGAIDMHPLTQRTDNLWTIKQKSELLMTIVKNSPIGNIVVANIDDRETDEYIVNILVDGLQRLTTIYDFMHDKFKINKNVGIVIGEYVNEKKSNEIMLDEIVIGGKYFSQLPPLIQQKFKDYRMTFYEYGRNYTIEEIDNVMFSMNNGAAFKPWQKVKTKLGLAKMSQIYNILKNTDWESVNGIIIKDGKCKNDAHLGCVIRSMMLIDENNRGRNGLSIGSVNKYIDTLDDMSSNTYNSIVNELTELFEDFNDVMGYHDAGRLEGFIDASTLPHIISNIKELKDAERYSTEKYLNFLVSFVNGEFNFSEENTFEKFCTVKNNTKGSGGAYYGMNAVETKQTILDNALSEYFESNAETTDGIENNVKEIVTDIEIENTETEEETTIDDEVVDTDETTEKGGVSEKFDPYSFLNFDEVVIHKDPFEDVEYHPEDFMNYEDCSDCEEDKIGIASSY